MMEIKMRLQVDMYLDYFGFLFPKDPDSGVYKVSSSSDFGKLLIAYAKVSDRPVKEPEPAKDETLITLSLPLTDSTQDLQNKWLYYTAAGTERLKAVLTGMFNMDFISYYLKGKAMGVQKKEIIQMFIVSRQLISSDPFEAIHKRVYRLEQEKMKRRTAMLLRKAYYFEESINTAGLL